MASRSVSIFMMGGTIDSKWDGIKDTVIPHKKSIMPEYIKGLKIEGKFDFREICLKDSRSLTKNDLQKLVLAVQKSKSKRILITHGTYTMVDTARYLKANLKTNDKAVILTGGFIPLSRFVFSDSAFNIGFSLAELGHLKSGIYVCMNGKVFEPEHALKIIPKGRFSSIFYNSPQ